MHVYTVQRIEKLFEKLKPVSYLHVKPAAHESNLLS